MSGDGRPSISGGDITDTRFSAPAMPIVNAADAALSAVLGPIVRSIDAKERMPLLATWGVWLAASIAWVGYLTHQRRQAERLVGGALLKLPLYDENVPQASSVRRWFNVVMALFFALF